jgi:starch phosphorylase
VGHENLFIFGATIDEIQRQTTEGSYRPAVLYAQDARIRRIVDTLVSEWLAPDEPGIFAPIRDTLLADNERYFHLADLGSYCETQQRAALLWRDRRAWARRALLTISRMGYFSSDRTVQEYASEIWGLEPVP